ncbi:hypothetical protein SRHO_G00000510 [Serrasalmus rhombeus]
MCHRWVPKVLRPPPARQVFQQPGVIPGSPLPERSSVCSFQELLLQRWEAAVGVQLKPSVLLQQKICSLEPDPDLSALTKPVLQISSEMKTRPAPKSPSWRPPRCKTSRV